jgi:hypothetical protein
MTSPILPLSGALTPTGSSRHKPSVGDTTSEPAAFESELTANDRGQSRPAHPDVNGGAPPPEVLDQIEAAGRISRQLRESGHELRFSEGRGGRVTVELSDREGNTVKSMLVSEALEIATGKPVQDITGKPLK